MYRADYHVHTAFSQDSKAHITTQIEEAIRQRFDEIAITDHMEKEDIDGVIRFNMQISDYLRSVKEMQEYYKNKIKIKIGVEVGYEPRWHEEIMSLIKPEDFDFIICSTHKCEEEDMGEGKFFEGKTQRQGYMRYFEEVLNTIRQFENFNVFGHIDYINRYGQFNDKILCIKDYKDVIYEMLKRLKDSSRGIEINTSGIRYGLGHFNPQIEVLKMYLDMGGEIITIGSDSHFTQHIGYLWDEAALLLQNIGFKYYTTFEKGKPLFHHL